MELQDLYNLIEAHLDNEIPNPQRKMKRVKLPIPNEYGGGFATGWGYEEAVRNLIKKVQEKIKMEVKAPLFKDCYAEWIKLKEGQQLSPSTIASYRYVTKTYLLPKFGDKAINSISSDDIQIFYNSIMNLSKSVTNQCQAVLKGVFNRAARMGHVDKDIMLYKYERSNKVGNKIVLQDSDLVALIGETDILKETFDYGRDYIYASFLCFTSLRRGEILGLRWEDLDFKRMEIHVLRNVSFPNGQNDPIIREPKDKSFGTARLSSILAKRLSAYRKDHGFVIPYDKENDFPITKSMFSKMWSRISKNVNLKGATSHSFRASYATMMNTHCDHIDPKALQGALRHKTPDLAIKVYTKENIDKTKAAEEEYDKWLSDMLAR